MKDVSVLYSNNEHAAHIARNTFLEDKACVVDLIERSGSHFQIRMRRLNGKTQWFSGEELIGKGVLPVEIERFCKTEMLRTLVGK